MRQATTLLRASLFIMATMSGVDGTRGDAQQSLHEEDNLVHQNTHLGPFNDDFNQYVKGILDHFNVPSISLAVIRDGQTFIKVIESSS
jgi:hypothetical protein